MAHRFTKTFIERQWYIMQADKTWLRHTAPEPDQPLDQQVESWVLQTGNYIVHPGQLSTHMEWTDETMRVKHVSLGLTVLFVKEEDENG